jgi:UDP-galactopyranose mutase
MTCVVEFAGHREQSFAENQVKSLPGNMIPLSYNYQHSSYVLQSRDTRSIVKELRNWLGSQGISLVGRFAEWEYYNMDKAIESAMALSRKF